MSREVVLPVSIWDSKPHLAVRAKELEAKGMNCRQIAAALGNGITRQSVLGKLYRLRGMKPAEGREHNNPRKLPVTAGAPSKPKKPSSITIALPPGTFDAVKRPSPLPKEEECVGTVSLLSAADKQCRWPTRNQDGEAFICGIATFKGSLCESHWKRGHAPPKKPGAEAAE